MLSMQIQDPWRQSKWNQKDCRRKDSWNGWILTLWRHCCHMGTAIKHHVSDRVKSSFVIFDIRALWRLALSLHVHVSDVTDDLTWPWTVKLVISIRSIRAQYLENSWKCCLTTIANYYIVCCEAVRSAILATAWLLVWQETKLSLW